MRKCILIFMMIFIANNSFAQDLQYNLENPTERIELPKKLNEISGLDLFSDSVLVAVQDEKANVYFLSVTTGEITDCFNFGKDGDFEGIAHYKKHFYALRSDGKLYKVEQNKEVKTYDFKNSKNFDFEGLCLDKLNNRLLVACKEHGDKDERDYFFIYAFSLESKTYKKKPVFKIKRDKVHKKFKPSGIAIHPNGNIYVLSSFSKTVCVLSSSGEIIEVTELNKSIFNQPEGITFNSNGDLYISNEKKNNSPTLLKFNSGVTIK